MHQKRNINTCYLLDRVLSKKWFLNVPYWSAMYFLKILLLPTFMILADVTQIILKEYKPFKHELYVMDSMLQCHNL